MTRSALVLALVVALTVAARSFLPDEATITGSGGALAFGFLLLAAIQSGKIFGGLRQPQLTGFLVCGAVFGPQVLGLLTRPMLHDLTVVKKVAVGLIALIAGCELNFTRLRPKILQIGAISTFALVGSAVMLFAFLFAISPYLPVTAAMSRPERLAVALLCTNVLIALSPAVVMGILTEARAQGPFSELVLSITVVADLAIAVSYTLSDSVVRRVFPQEGHSGGATTLVVHILGSMVVGLAIGALLAFFIRRVGSHVGLFVFAVLFVAVEAGGALHLDPLLMGLAAGLFLENVSPVSGHEVIRHTEIAAMPTFAVFFGVIGAEVDLGAFRTIAPYAAGAALTRWLGIRLGVAGAARLTRVPAPLARRLPAGLTPQAGIAIALANLVAESFEPWGKGAATLVLGTVVVNQVIGPIVLRSAVLAVGEAGKRSDSGPAMRPSHVSLPGIDSTEPARPPAPPTA